MVSFVTADEIRSRFSDAMSAMYRNEVPQYGTLLSIVADVNRLVLDRHKELRSELKISGELDRLDVERHGAIRLGTAEELSTMRRLFRVMGMEAVGYYDLAPAGVPVHSTAFRATGIASLNRCPFRIFTSLLRLDLIGDAGLRALATTTLKKRRIFTARVLKLIWKYEVEGKLTAAEGEEFVTEALETFRWHRSATVSERDYRKLVEAHRLVADVVSFRGPHINHLTPRTLDIDAVQREMPMRGISAKTVVEGPPSRRCPILLRQTSFKALEEPVNFVGERGVVVAGSHTARFGEIEQRGVALTPAGRAMYDRLLGRTRDRARALPDGSNAAAYASALAKAFCEFPDDYATLRAQGLAYFRYRIAEPAQARAGSFGMRPGLEDLIRTGAVGFQPVVYEDFLPVSAAGIFQSNLGSEASIGMPNQANRTEFEEALGTEVINEFDLYENIQAASIARCERDLGWRFPDADSQGVC